MRRFFGSWIFLIILLLLDIYVFQAVKSVSQNLLPKWRLIIFSIYWVVSVICIIYLAILPFINTESLNKTFRTYSFAIIVGIFLAKLLSSVFFLMDDVRRGLQWSYGFLTSSVSKKDNSYGDPITRSAFLNWLGLGIGGGLFTSLLYGFGNKYRYELRNISLKFNSLPSSFKGLKIVHISDIHAGSFMDKDAVRKGVLKILQQKPDIILFTGDLVNNLANEMDDYLDVFDKLTAPYGVYSTLGNHDYADYYYGFNPDSEEKRKSKQDNLEQLKKVHARLGWRLLNDENIVLEKDNEKIAIIGVQNISGKNNFHSYGDLSKAYTGTENIPFKILLSHDPSHWNKEVITKYKDIDLMLSGHTHGMQFGVEIPGLKWSPVKYFYDQWAGLYEKENQKIYVNRGFGFIGYPGRVGILPEITVIDLI